ncbi:23S rRNA (adenosine(1067)-2'-O)-methyltransferase [Planctomycetes bacterium Poly30]|uniref:23S rRNA (Adenosine(1067)-2'-O)-methyltransferase n=1 Tax=Saltatorellus ferox TaxID=2528018 RepID=A0A518F0R3_9BACT|nr:23S rRNA (adenosine(1067)-2'-O)-methyltransferase [Planctomycetes bacterium Poly30]
MNEFATILHGLKSPTNVGSIVRTHVAMGGGPLLMVGHERPWDFRKSSQAFSRKLETMCEITYVAEDAEFFDWCRAGHWGPVAIEIRPGAASLHEMVWPDRVALVLGNERDGLSEKFIEACTATVRIPQFGPVASLNVAIAHGMATYELQRSRRSSLKPIKGKYPEPLQAPSKPWNER